MKKTIFIILTMMSILTFSKTNNAELKEIYNDIDRLEKTKMDVKKFSKRYEAYEPFALIAILSLLLEILLRLTILRRIP